MTVEVFETVLRESMDRALQGLRDAQQDASPAEVHKHAARVMDLLDRARNYGVATTGWVPDSLLEAVRAGAGR